MSVINVRNSSLRVIATALPLNQDINVSPVLDFRDAKHGTIQIVREGGDQYNGEFSLKISLLCDPSTFFCYPNSEIKDCTEVNLGWVFREIPFRYAQVIYKKGTDTMGTFDVYATGKR